jgi:hypothetical protein
VAVHKARCELVDLPEEARSHSRAFWSLLAISLDSNMKGAIAHERFILRDRYHRFIRVRLGNVSGVNSHVAA